MRRVLITGASGMVGGIVLRECLASEQISSVTSLARRPSGLGHPKLKEVVHTDFSDLDPVKEHFADKDIAYFCIGVYTGVAKDLFEEVTLNQPKAFTDALKEESPKASLCFLSGAGADQSETSKIAFARLKGMAENHLISMDLGSLCIFRPGYIYPVKKRKEPNLMYSISRAIYPIMGPFMKNSSITSEELGKAMFKVGIEGAPKTILENKDIRALLS